MRVALVSPYSFERPGGVQTQVAELTERLRAAGHVAWVVAPGRTGPPQSRLVGRATSVPVNRSTALVSLDPKTVALTRRAIADADVVHLHEPFVPLTGPAAFLRRHPPILATFHADPSAFIRTAYRAASPMLGRVMQKLEAVTAVSRAAASAVRPFAGEVTIIPNGIDIGAHQIAVERDPHRIVFVGRDERRKGLDVLLAAWPAVHGSVPGAELTVIGAERAVRVPGVRFLGTVVGAEKRRHLAGAAVYCGPNLGGESFGLTLVEAMAAGCAPVISDLAPFRDVADGAARYVHADDPAALADALVRALTDEVATAAAGKRARRAARRYDWDNVLPLYVAMYQQVIG